MAYDPTEPTTRDMLRRLVGDTDDEAPILADATYDAILSQYGAPVDPILARDSVPYLRAAAEVARSVAVAIEQDPTSINAPGDGAISWSSRTASLQKLAVSFDAQADRLEWETERPLFGAPVTIRGTFLRGTGEG